MKKILNIQVLVLIAVLLLPAIIHAQPGFGDDVVDDVPVDGGLSLLVAAGIGYGAKKLKGKKSELINQIKKIKP